MLKIRVIPVLLFDQHGLYKTSQFRNPVYIGDPINSVRILNEKGVDELIFLDIGATKNNRPIDCAQIADIASECFMPFAVGGGIRTLKEMETVLKLGAEKMVLSTLALTNSQLIQEAVKQFGGQSIVISLDIRRSFLGRYELYAKSGREKINVALTDFISQMEDIGVGELLVHSIDREGTRKGYDITLMKSVTEKTHLPVIACGGANTLDDFKTVVSEGAVSAVAAGSCFVFHGKHRAVLITYPSQKELHDCFS